MNLITFSENRIKYGYPFIGFDIETTRGNYGSYMYIAMFGTPSGVLWARTWDEVKSIMKELKEIYQNYCDRIICFIHNASYEFQFMRKEFHVTEIFAKEKREILKFVVDGFFEFRDSLAITGCSLESSAVLYGLDVKKKTGDLNYSKKRNSKTPLDKKELGYCSSDVLVLVELAKKFNDLYLKDGKGFIPLTKTAILRHEVKQLSKAKKYSSVLKNIRWSFPATMEKYQYYMKYLFQGGVTHTNLRYAGILLHGVTGLDIKSDYPFQICGKDMTYPTGLPIPIPKPTREKVESYFEKYHVVMALDIKGIRLKDNCPFSFISKSKMVDHWGLVEDNGKLFQAKRIQIMATELDYEILIESYDIDKITITYAEYYQKTILPDYIRQPILEGFIEKEKLGSDSPFYKLAKQKPNSGYGMMVTRFNTSELIVQDGEVVEDEDFQFNYKKQVRNAFLSPIQGLYVTARARHTLIKMANKVGSDCVYCDTDSLYILNYEKHKHLFDSYNEKIIASNKDYLPAECIMLGTFSNEGNCTKFKALGAKRYIYRRKGKIKTTVSGMRKDTLQQYAESIHKSVFDIFTDGLVLDCIFSNKTTAEYVDEPTEEYIEDEFGNIELMKSKSSMNIIEIPFSMKIKEGYSALFESFQQALESKHEIRL